MRTEGEIHMMKNRVLKFITTLMQRCCHSRRHVRPGPVPVFAPAYDMEPNIYLIDKDKLKLGIADPSAYAEADTHETRKD